MQYASMNKICVYTMNTYMCVCVGVCACAKIHGVSIYIYQCRLCIITTVYSAHIGSAQLI